MISWIWFVLFSQFIWSVTSIIDKFVISRGYIRSPFVYIVLNGLSNLLVFLLIPLIDVKPLGAFDFAVLFIAGAFFSAAVISYYKAVQYDEISRVSMMGQLAPVFVMIASFLVLGESLTRNHFIGFFSLLMAGIVVSYKKENRKFTMSPALSYMLLSAFFGTVAFVAARHIIKATDFWNAFFWFRISGLAALAVLIVPSIRKEFADSYRASKKGIRGLLGFKMFIDFSAFVFSNYAILYVPAIALMSALSSSIQPIIIFVLTLICSLYLPKIISESVDKKALATKLVAIILIAFGITFINL